RGTRGKQCGRDVGCADSIAGGGAGCDGGAASGDLESGDAGIVGLAGRTAAARSTVAKLVMQNGGRLSAAEYGRQLERARAEMEGLESELAVKSATFRHTWEQDRAGYEEVRAALPAGSGLVAFRRFERKGYGGG